MANILHRGQLLDHRGNPLRSSSFKKDNPPALGPSYGSWSGDKNFLAATGPFASMGLVQFDLSQLTLADFRNMRDHPQVNASLSVLSFMQHQSPWEIKCDNAKIRDFCQDQLEARWTELNRAMSQANWAGYSPCILEWDNDVDGKQVVLSKIKDLMPENCVVNWKEIDGKRLAPNSVPPKLQVYDGIRQFGQAGPIPKDATFWYPIQMENGDYYGRKLLRAAFTAWYFSLIIHVYANRYYERYGEPTPVGRASFDDEIDYNGSMMPGNQYMLSILADLRNRAVVVLPNDGQEDSSGKFRYDYDIKFLESQMRGADFERYLTRLDEEISLALFTPVLLMRVADVGSYNLGQGHMQVFLWVMNAMNSDRAYYINKYILNPLVNYNFGPKADRATIEFRKLGDQDLGTVKEVLTALINHGIAMPDLEQLGQMAGMSLNDIRNTLGTSDSDSGEDSSTGSDNSDENGQSDGSSSSSDDSKGAASAKKSGDTQARRAELVNAIATRLHSQVARAYRTGNFDGTLSLGHTRELSAILSDEGVRESRSRAFSAIGAAQERAELDLHAQLHPTAGHFMEDFERHLVDYLASA